MSGASGGGSWGTVNLMVCIDGTHDGFLDKSKEDYDADFKNSHVVSFMKLARGSSRFKLVDTRYIQGPSTSGSSTDDKFVEALRFILERVDAHPKDQICLHFAGYSRGAAIALDLANGFAHEAGIRLRSTSQTPGESYNSLVLFNQARKALGSRGTVGSLTMFDAVDMSGAIDGNPVAARIGTVAHVVRSATWGSRNGWGNVGAELAKGSPPRNGYPLEPIDGTHAALGGLPGTGDLPKPMLKELLELPKGEVDWQAAERRFRGQVAPQAVCAIGKPGIFVNWKNASLLDLASKLEIDHGTIGFRRVGRTAPEPLRETMREAMQAYIDDPGGSYGLWHLKHEWKFKLEKGKGSFESIGIPFAGSAAAAKIIERYRRADQTASKRAWAVIESLSGHLFK